MKVITSDHGRSRPYVDAILQEMEQVVDVLPPGARRVSQLHFGGGTPNFLQPEELIDIVTRLKNTFDFLPEAEVAIEMHPRTSTRAFCENLKKLEFNRISLGVQDFDPKVQTLINRLQSYEMTEAMVRLLRELGFSSFNFDLIYGLPGQSMSGWKKTLEQVLHLRPNRLAVYSYAHVPWVSPVQRSFKDSDLPSPAMKLEIFEAAYSTLTKAGYRPIGMDHFALEDDELSQAHVSGSIHRNFMGYSTRADAHQLGFGVSAISYVGGNYFQNLKELSEYESTVNGGQLATFRGFLLNRDDAIRRDLITRIMCLGRVPVPDFESRWDLDFEDYFAQDLPALNGMIADRLVRLDAHELSIEGEGHLFLRNVAMAFDRYLEGIQKTAKNPTFSKTV
jgi:oxygen-independent coproporphyrinogen-3 oxidase